MRVAIIGGTRFVGHYITEQLLAADIKPVLLVRPGSENVDWGLVKLKTLHWVG